MNNPDYQTVYGVGLLDDLHNYFPALLYEQGRFQTLPQVFSYTRNQLNTRFNLFSYGASLHRAARPRPAPVAPVPVAPRQREEDNAMNLITSLLGLDRNFAGLNLGGLGGIGGGLGGIGPTRADIWGPVVVIPTTEVLAANTEIIMGSTLSLTQNSCSVCQDVMVTNDECRRLRPCQHSFHKVCIDQWFLRSVFCPTCRHDIRNATPSPRLSGVAPIITPPVFDLSGNT